MQDYLTPEGQAIYKAILAHIDKNNWSMDIDDFELSMLANAFDMYAKCAKYVKENGVTQTANSGFSTARPEIAVMKTEYANVLKHSAKFGLNPGDRKKIFKVADAKRQKKQFGVGRFDLRSHDIKKGDSRYTKEFEEWWEENVKDEPKVDYTQIDRYWEYRRRHREDPEGLLEML